MKKILIISWLSFLFVLIGWLFWRTDLVYQLPTPVPAGYQPVSQGTPIVLRPALDAPGKPMLLHFYNPGCPCSRFNIPALRRLYAQYHNRVAFRVVVLSKRKFDLDEIRRQLALPVSVSADTVLARRCGVYATPQIALLDGAHRLYYRGNYNRSRYCLDERTNYARQALTALLDSGQQVKALLAYKAYGCQWSGCKRKEDN